MFAYALLLTASTSPAQVFDKCVSVHRRMKSAYVSIDASTRVSKTEYRNRYTVEYRRPNKLFLRIRALKTLSQPASDRTFLIEGSKLVAVDAAAGEYLSRSVPEAKGDLASRALQPDQLKPSLLLDAEVSLRELTLDRLAELEVLKPTGQGNPAVKLAACNLSSQRPPQRLGNEKQHVKLWATDGRAVVETVWWSANGASLPVGRFDLAFEPQINEFNGRRTVQLKLLDWRPAQENRV